MKKLFGILMIVFLGLAACEGPMGPPGRDGKDGMRGEKGADGTNAIPTEWTILHFRIQLNQWQLAGDYDEIGSYYWCMFDVPEITKDIYDDGLIICSYLYVDSEGYDVQTILPYTEYFIDVDRLNNEFPFAMHLSYNVTPTSGRNSGTIEFRVTFSDFLTWEKSPPQICNFKLTLVY